MYHVIFFYIMDSKHIFIANCLIECISNLCYFVPISISFILYFRAIGIMVHHIVENKDGPHNLLLMTSGISQILIVSFAVND